MRTTIVSSIRADTQHSLVPLVFALDCPQIGNQGDVAVIDIAGWIFSDQAQIHTIEVYYRPAGEPSDQLSSMLLLSSLPLVNKRPDVVDHFKPRAVAQQCGFSGSISLLGMPPAVTLVLAALLEHGQRCFFVQIDVQRAMIRPTYRPRLQPLLLSAHGRSGTTWMMQLLNEHPRIVAQRPFPYEMRFALYWLHLLKVTTDPIDGEHYGDAYSFLNEWDHIGHNPFGISFHDPAELRRWLRKEQIEEVATFVQRMIDQHYLRVAHSQGCTEAIYFCEKSPMLERSRLQWLAHEMYPEAREIFLVRDLRDRLCSVLKFNAQRGHAGFGRERVHTDMEYVQYIAEEMRTFLADWQQRADQSILIRYEDLAYQPHATLRAVYDYLELESDDDLINRAIVRVGSASEHEQHRTSVSLDASIGRWRHDLSPQLQQACGEAFRDLLTAFGYE